MGFCMLQRMGVNGEVFPVGLEIGIQSTGG